MVQMMGANRLSFRVKGARAQGRVPVPFATAASEWVLSSIIKTALSKTLKYGHCGGVISLTASAQFPLILRVVATARAMTHPSH
jgi:hypothetical protein